MRILALAISAELLQAAVGETVHREKRRGAGVANREMGRRSKSGCSESF
jgi:hypothetical protein